MRRIIFIALLFLPMISFGQFTKTQMHQGVTTNIRPGLTPFKVGNQLDSMIHSFQLNMNTTTVGLNFLNLTNPSAITFSRINADNTVSALDAATFRTAIGAGTGGGTVTIVGSADGSITVTNPTTTVDLAVVKSPSLTTPRTIGTGTGDVTSTGSSFNGTANNTNAYTLATVNSNVGSFGSATQTGAFTVNGKGLITAASNTTITPAIGSITGLGTGVAIALSVNVGTAGSFVVNGGALGTPSSGTATNLTGTASGLTAGNVTTNANLTGVITSVGNTTSIASQTGTGTKFVVDNTPTLITPILGVASGTSLSLTGTGGTGFLELPTQSSSPSAPSGGTRIFSNSASKLSWRGSANTFVKTFDGSLATANRLYSLMDVDGYMAETSTILTNGSITVVGANGIMTEDSPYFNYDGNNHRFLLGGTTTSYSFGATTAKMQLTGVDVTAALAIMRFSNTANPSRLVMGASRGTTIGSFTASQNADNLARQDFVGADGTDADGIAASILIDVDGIPDGVSHHIPGRFRFLTATSGGVNTEALRINSAQAIGLGGANFGTVGQVIISNGSAAGNSYSSTPTLTGTNFSGVPYSALSGTVPFYSLASGGTATGTNTFSMGSNPFIMTTGVTTGTGATAGFQLVGNSATTGNIFDISTTSLTSGVGIKLSFNGTAINNTAGTNSLAWFEMSGANANASRTATALTTKVTNTGTTGINVGIYSDVSGASSSNWSFIGANGSMLLGSTQIDATSKMQIKTTGGAATGFIMNSSSASGYTEMNIQNSGAENLGMYMIGSSGGTTAVPSSAAFINTSGAGGMVLTSANATASMRFVTGANNYTTGIRLLISSSGNFAFTQGAQTSTWGKTMLITPGAHTGLTTATEFIDVDFAARAKAWVDGTVTTQRDWYIRGQTYNKTTTSATFTNPYTAYIEAPTAGTGVTFTNGPYALGLAGSLSLISGTTASLIRLFEPSGSGTNSSSFKAQAQGSDINYTLPATDVTNGFLKSDGSGGLTWSTATGWSASGATTITGNTSQTGSFINTFSLDEVDITQNALSSGSQPTLYMLQGNHTGGAARIIKIEGGSLTNQTAGTDIIDLYLSFNRVIQHATGSLALNRTVYIDVPTHSFVGASTLTNATAVEIHGAPIAGTNATVTNTHGILVNTGASVGAGTVNSYGLTVNALTGATNNYTAQFLGGGNFTIVNDGRIYGSALHNNAGAVTGPTNQYIASGTYTPTLTNVANVTASTAYACQWMRVGNVVTVSGQVDIDVTLAASTASELGVSLPIASSITAVEQVGGDAISDSVASLSARIKADATNDRASVVFKAISLTNDTYSFTFTYVIL